MWTSLAVMCCRSTPLMCSTARGLAANITHASSSPLSGLTGPETTGALQASTPRTVQKHTPHQHICTHTNANCSKIIIGATYDVLPTPQNLSQWVGEVVFGCWLIKTYILSGCKTSLTQGRYRHDQVLK